MNKRVLITGASKGIGFALTKLFLEKGYKVIGACRNGKIENLSHPNLDVIELDLSNSSSIKDAAQILRKESKIDILINNAGIGPDLDLDLPTEETFKQTFDVNVTGTVLFTESLIEIINHGGSIINISSEMGCSIENCKRIDSVAYRMSKGALNMYTKILSNRLKASLKVVSIHPGWVRTTIAESNIDNGRLSPEESAIKLVEYILSDFETGTFWDVESQAKLDW
jgi:NAD(P)-dependent dehydrogenase (short-subunit alcohol dehydrogenase family)